MVELQNFLNAPRNLTQFHHSITLCTFLMLSVLLAAIYRVFITTVKITFALVIRTTAAGTCALSNLSDQEYLVLYTLSGTNQHAITYYMFSERVKLNVTEHY